MIWDADSAKPVAQLREEQSSIHFAPHAIFFSADGSRVLAVSFDGLQVWDTATGRTLSKPFKPKAGIGSAAVSNDARRVAALCNDNTAWVWDALSGILLCQPIKCPGRIFAACFTADDLQLITSAGSRLDKWELRPTIPVVQPELTFTNSFEKASFSHDSKLLAGLVRERLQLWDLERGALRAEMELPEGPVAFSSFSSDGSKIFCFSKSQLRCWETKTGRLVQKFSPQAGLGTRPMRGSSQTGPESAMLAAAFSGDAQQLFIATSKSEFRLNLKTAQVVQTPFTHAAWTARFSPDGYRLAVASLRSLQILAAESGELSRSFEPTIVFDDFAFSPDRRWLFAHETIVGHSDRIFNCDSPIRHLIYIW